MFFSLSLSPPVQLTSLCDYSIIKKDTLIDMTQQEGACFCLVGNGFIRSAFSATNSGMHKCIPYGGDLKIQYTFYF